jgi:hypothetical protein
MNRRHFVKTTVTGLGAALLFAETTLLTGCASVGQELLIAFKAVLGILSGAGIIPGGTLVTAVIGALTDVITELTAYANAPAADKATVGLKLATFIQIAQDQLQNFYSQLGLSGVLAGVVESLIAVILSTLGGLLPTLPVPPQAALNIQRHVIYVPTLRNARQFRDDFNSAMTRNGYPKVNF